MKRRALVLSFLSMCGAACDPGASPGAPAPPDERTDAAVDPPPTAPDGATAEAVPMRCGDVDAGSVGPVGPPGPTAARPFLALGSANLGAANQLVSGFSESAWVALVPRQAPRLHVKCPATGTEIAFTWAPTDPDKISCGGATYVYTSAPHHVSIVVPSGRTVQLPAWPMPNGQDSFVGAAIDQQKGNYLAGKLRVLAAAYHASHDERYARRIALALDAWADVAPDYYLSEQNQDEPITSARAGQLGYKGVQRFSDNNGVGQEMHLLPVEPLDAIWEASVLTTLSGERGHDVREHIVKDLYLDEMRYLIDVVPLGAHTATNLSYTYDKMGLLAQVLGRRGGVVEFLDRYMAATVLNVERDGMYPESFGYHGQYIRENAAVVDHMRDFEALWPPQDAAQQAVAAHIDGYERRMADGFDATAIAALPDGMDAPFGDTLLRPGTDARSATRSGLLPAYGHAVLGAGTGDQQVQVNLGFQTMANHVHQDVLALTLYAFGRELTSNIRYSRIPGRRFTSSTVAKNTVVVDRKAQFRGRQQGSGNAGHLFTSGDVNLFEPGVGGVAVADVDGTRAYTGTADRYQRITLLNTMDPAHPYVVDIFRVKGGGTHDWFFHGATRFDETTSASLPLAAVDATYPLLPAGTTWTEPTGEGDERDWYGAFRHMSRGSTPADAAWNVTFRESGGTRGTRVHMIDPGGRQVWLGVSPAPYRDDWPDTLYDHWRPSLMVRRTGSALDTSFVAVIEPFDGEPAITRIARVPLAGGDADELGLRVELPGGRVDTWLVDTRADRAQPATLTTADAAFQLVGRVGVASSGPAGEHAVLIAGTRFVHHGHTLSGKPTLRGTISGVVRAQDGCSADALVADASLPAGNALAGRWVRVSFDRYAVVPEGSTYPQGVHEQRGLTQLYRVVRVERQDGKSYLVLDADPMLRVDAHGATELTRPGRTFTGPVSFEIARSARD